SGPMFPARRSAAAIDLPPPPTPTVAPTLPGTLRMPGAAPSAPPVAIRKIRRGRAVLVGFATIVAVGAAVWVFATPSPEPAPGKAAPSPPLPAVAPPVRSQAEETPPPSRSIEQVRAL